MFNFYYDLKKYIENYAFEILLIGSVLFILLYALFRWGKKGSYDRYYVTYADKPTPAPKTPKKDSSGELRCRAFLEKYFNKPFNKARPNFLNNPVTGGDYNLELDCYNSHLKLACEYNGRQHYDYVPFFHKNKEAFLNQKYRDEMKRTRCREYGIKLIEVPYSVKNIEHYLHIKLKELGY